MFRPPCGRRRPGRRKLPIDRNEEGVVLARNSEAHPLMNVALGSGNQAFGAKRARYTIVVTVSSATSSIGWPTYSRR